MILSLIVSDITNTAVFIQGSPGSGKTCAANIMELIEFLKVEIQL